MLLKIFKNRTVSSSGTWGTKNENNYEILNFEFPEELEEYNKRIVYYLGNQKVWDPIIDNKAILTNAITTKGSVKAYIWCTKSDEAFETDVDFRTQIFVMNFFENENADGIVPTPVQVDGFNTMLTAMNEKIEEIDELETTIENAETQRQENEETRQENESTRQENEQTRQEQEAERERRTDEAIGNIEDKTAEYNANAEAKTTAFNQNATQKTNDFNNNYTQKVNDFNTNASSKETAFNSNAESKTSTFNTNATNKTNDFNSNASSKTTAFNNNATSKTTDFNTNAENKTTTFNENATSKTGDFNDNATAKTTAFNENAQAKTEAFDEHTTEITADIEDLQQEVEELSQNMPWNTTEQATEISVDDAAKYSRNKLELFGNTEQAQYTGKNLFSGWEEGQIDTTTGQEIVYKNRYRSKFIEILPNTNYFFSVLRPETPQSFWFSIKKYDENKNYLGSQRLNNDSPSAYRGIINIEDINVKFIRITEIASLEYLVDTQLELGTERTDYEPYVGGQPSPSPDYPQDIHVVTGNNTISIGNTNYPINLGSLELCKIGDYQDYLYKENGNWYKYETIRKLVLNGRETWNMSSQYTDETYFCAYYRPGNLNNNTDVLCNKLKYGKYSASPRPDYDCIACMGNTLNIQILLSRLQGDTLNDLKTWLSSNNLTLYTILLNPTKTQITDETLIAQLDAIYEHLQLVKGTNHITITPSDLEPYVTLNYMQDLPSKLDNLDSRLSLLE